MEQGRYETPLTIAEVMQKISNNKYVLPSIQREYVWGSKQIEALFDSLMRGYPISTFLFWEIDKKLIEKEEYDFYGFINSYSEMNGTHNEKINLRGSDGVTAVLDGQQRLTSLYIGLKGTYAYKLKYARNNLNAYPVRKLYLNLLRAAQNSDNEYDFRFLTKEEKENNQDFFWFEVGRILNMSVGDVTSFVIEHIINSKFHYSKEQSDYATYTLARLHDVIHIYGIVSYYRETSVELDKVLNIFVRVNSGGTKLSYSDLLLSIASAQWKKHDAREEITKFVDEINHIGDGFRIDKDFVLKTALVLSDFTNIAFKVGNFNKSNMMIIEDNWDNIKTAITHTLNLVSSFGYSGVTLSSNNALIPIAYYLLKVGIVSSSITKDNRTKIKKWLIQALLKRAFSGQSDNVLRHMREVIRNESSHDFPYDALVDKFKEIGKPIQFTDDDIEQLLKLQYGERDTLSALMLLYPSLDFSNKFHEDHMYPKSKFKKSNLRKMGMAEDKLDEYIGCVDEISNLQLLAAQLNEEKNNTDFDVWFKQKHVTDAEKIQYRTINHLPELEYSYDNFLKFMEARRELLKKEFEKVLR